MDAIKIYYFELAPRVVFFFKARSYSLGKTRVNLRHARPYVRMYQHGCHWTDFREICYWWAGGGLRKNKIIKKNFFENRTKNIGALYVKT